MGKADQVLSPDQARSEGARNLLVNCAGIKPGMKVLFVNESGTPTIDKDTVTSLENGARALGADVKSIWAGPVPGPESIPDTIMSAIAASDVSIFNHSLGGMLRLRPIPGSGLCILNYATTPELLASEWVRVPYDVWKQVAGAVAKELKKANTWRIRCPNGTDLSGSVPERERTVHMNESGLMLHTFPIGTHQPTSATTATGTLAIRWLVSSANHDIGDGLRLETPIVAKVEAGRIVDFSGDPKEIGKAKTYLEEIGRKYGKDPYVINSWHGGTNPLAFVPQRDVAHLNWWQLLSHNNPRTLHFHVVGDDMPGEFSLPIIDPVVEFDGDVVWNRGSFTVLDRPSVQSIVSQRPDLANLFKLNSAIGIE